MAESDRLRLEYVPLDTALLWEKNPKLHDLDALIASIERYGFKDPPKFEPELNGGKGGIVEGNGRFEALAAMRDEGKPAPRGVEQLEGGRWVVPVLFGVDAGSEAAAQAYGIDHNNLTLGGSPLGMTEMMSLWSEGLDAVLQGLSDTGEMPVSFDEDWGALLSDEEPAADPGPQIDKAAELQGKWGTALGQVWEIPSLMAPDRCHRLMCGDCTDRESVRRLMTNERAILFATDPPYLVGYDGTNHPHKWSQPDKNKDWSESYGVHWDEGEPDGELYRGFIRCALDVAIEPNAAWYCWHASKNQAMLETVWDEFGAFVHQQIIWVKDRAVLTRSWYMWQHEPCFFGWVKGNKPPRTAEDYPHTVWNIPTVAPGTTTLHPTSKPVEVFAIPMRQHCRAGDICYEPFAGSGSQLVAGEQTGRLVYGMEISPAYVAVILERLAGMGLEPALGETVSPDRLPEAAPAP